MNVPILMIKVGMLTSWNTRCGISEYSRYLVSALRKRDDIDVTVFGSKNYGHYKIAEDESYVSPTFAVLPWNKYGDHSFDYEQILQANLDVLHIQYEVLLYNQQGFNKLLELFPGLKVITYHDNCIPPGFPYWAFQLKYTHREDVGVGQGYILPMGVEYHKPVVKTFGLGRSRRDLIQKICDANDWTFNYVFGEEEWIPQKDLHTWLRDSDAIVLWYDDSPAAGSSQAIRTAIATRRLIFCNNCTWFKDVESNDQIFKLDSPVQLEQYMKSYLNNPDIETNSWDRIADTIVKDYNELLRDSS